VNLTARYDTRSHAVLALRQWRGLYGDPEGDAEPHLFRVRHVPFVSMGKPYNWAVCEFETLQEAEEVDSDGQVREEAK